MRLVDADYLKEKGHYDDHDEFVVDYDDIKNAPTVDIDEIIERIKELGWEHGHWEDENMDDQVVARCSVCNTWDTTRTPYCPNCGAKMDGDEDETV